MRSILLAIALKSKWFMAASTIFVIFTLCLHSYTANQNFTKLYKNVNRINNISLPEHPFFVSSKENISPYNGIGSINLNKLSAPSKTGKTQFFFNISVTTTNENTELTSETCYTTQFYYFISKNTFPDISAVDNTGSVHNAENHSTENQTIFPVQHARLY